MAGAHWGITTAEGLIPGDIVLRLGQEVVVDHIQKSPNGHSVYVFYMDGSAGRYGKLFGTTVRREKDEISPEFGVSPYKPLESITYACEMLDVVKQEWGECWSEHDQKVRAGLSAILKSNTVL